MSEAGALARLGLDQRRRAAGGIGAVHADAAVRRLPAPPQRGIRDLRNGSLVDEDWHGRDPDALRARS